MTDPDLNAVVDRIIACQYAVVPDGDRAAILRELRAVQAATWREAAEYVETWGPAPPNPRGRRATIGAYYRDRAAALHPKESDDE